MPDCSGYGFGVDISLCVNGPVGGGSNATLFITMTNTFRSNFDSSTINRNWDGSRTKFIFSGDELDFYGFNSVNCTTKEFALTIIPDAKANTGKLLLEFTLEGCSAAGFDKPQVFENCGGAGPFVISEMSTYVLDQASTCNA